MHSYAEIINALRREAKSRPDLKDTISLYVDLLTEQAAVRVAPRIIGLTQTDVALCLQEGRHLLSADALKAHGRAVTRLCFQTVLTTARHRRDLMEPLARIQAWLTDRSSTAETILGEYLQQGRVAAGEEAGLDRGLLAFVLNNGVRPFLRAHAEVLESLIDGRLWYRGFCPACGGEPDFAALERTSGARRLLCSRCDMEWPYYRVACPFCGSDEHIAYYPRATQYRLYVCEICKRYLKSVDLREVAEDRLLPVERILTVGMDVVAREAGWGAP